jgi:ribosomal protein S18 acetylase RimI-like enzyme
MNTGKVPSELSIRDFRMEDYDALISFWDESGLSYRPKGRDSRDDFERQLKLGTTIYLIAEIEGKMVGTLLGTHDGRKGWINRLAVSPGQRHKGIARRLVDELEERFELLGIGIVACMVEDWNEESLEVFDKLGYKRFPGITYFTKRKNEEI